MPEQVKVFCAEGRKVPREENPRKYYPAKRGDAVVIPRTPYIERLLLTGDLVDVAVPAETAAATAIATPAGKKKE